VWIAAGFLVYYNYQSRRALTEQRLQETSRALSAVVDRELASIEGGLSVLATSSSLTSGDLNGFYREAQLVLESYPGSHINLSDASGQEFVNTSRPFGTPLPRRNVSPETTRKIFTGHPYVANLFMGAVNSRFAISVDVPVFHNGKVVYDLAMVVFPDRFATILSQQQLPPDWLGTMFDGNQVIVARTRAADQLVGRKGSLALLEQMSNKTEGRAEFVNLEGVRMFDSFSRSKTSGWTVAIGVPKTIMMAGIWHWMAWTVVCTALFSLAGIVLALLLAKRIADSIQGLIAPALALGRGEPIAIRHLGLAETNEVGESLMKASKLIQERAAQHQREEAARHETEQLKLLNAELEHSEAAARALATELAAIMDAVPAVILIAHDAECRKITSNRAGYELLQMPNGSNLSQSAPGASRPTHYRLLRDGHELLPEEMPIQAAGAGHEIRDYAYTIVFDDGSSREMFGNAVQLLDENRRGRGAVSAFIDITERKSVEKQLRTAAERLQAILECAPVGIVLNDQEGRLLETNAAYQRMCGYSSEELKSTKFMDYTHPDDVARNLKLYEQLKRNKLQTFEIEKRYIRKDGKIIWVHLVASRLNEETSIGIAEDITARKQAEWELQSTTERLKAILDNAPVGIVTANQQNRFEQTNPAFQRMTGYSAEELLQMEWTALTHPDDMDRNIDLVDGLLHGNRKNYDFEKRYVLKDGKIIWVRVVGSRLDDDHKMSIIEDITARKRTEQALLASEQQLRQAQKMEAVGRLAGGIAHDFNNLLMVILSYTEMLQDSLPVHGALRKHTREIMRAAERAASLTGQMLAFSRKQIISPVVLNLNSAIDNTTKMLTRLIGEDIEFRVDTAKSVWAVEADPDQLAQVLMNLCVNSRDAMPQGGTLTITTGNVTVGTGGLTDHPDVSPGDYVMLSVADTGTGIGKNVMDQIFDPFFTTKEVGKGTGLGLAMVYGMVRQSGGHVWVDSEVGMGTCFTIYLPKVMGLVDSEMSVNAEKHPRGEGTLLVVEDEDALREAMCDYLRSLGYVVLEANSGSQALVIAAQQGEIDLLITDVVMPKMSGRELSQTMESLRPGMKTIHMSGYTDDAVLRHGISEGASFLQKPFSLGTLARKVHDALFSHKSAH
jgi:PAS domain S-box-containing protein